MYRLVNDKKNVIQSNEERRLEHELADSRVSSTLVELNEAKKYIARLEREVEFYRVKYDESLADRDRQFDALLAQGGFPEVTATSRKEHAATESKMEGIIKKRQEEVAEIFAESLEQMEEYDSLGLPSDLREEAAKLIAESKK